METKKNYYLPLAYITMLYFTWGFITCLNDILIPHFKEAFTLTYFESMLIQFAFFGAYTVGSIIYFIISSLYGDPINRIGYKNGIIYGLIVSGIGTFLFFPAAQTASFPFFLAALFILALGFTLLQIAANPYIILLGDPKTGAQRLNLAGAINSIGTTIAPLIGGAFIFSTASAGADLGTVKIPYLVLTGLFVLLIIIFKIIILPKFTNEDVIEKGVGSLQYPQLTLGIIAIFCYVGGEVTIGSFMTNYVGLTEIKGLSKEAATIYVSLYWGSLMIGRFMGSVSVFNFSKNVKNILTVVVPIATFFFILLMFKIKAKEGEVIDFDSMIKYYLPFILVSIVIFFLGKEKPARTLFLFSLVSILLLIVSLFTSGEVAMWSVISVGLYNSVMWPCIFALAIAGIGKYTSQGSSLLIMAILGGALIPPLQGILADKIGVQQSFVVPIVCYVYMVYYAIKAKAVLKKQGINDDLTASTTK